MDEREDIIDYINALEVGKGLNEKKYATATSGLRLKRPPERWR